MRSLFIALALLLALPVATAASQPGHQEHKKPICHRTAADSNPWVIITPDKRSWFAHLDRHVNHNPKNGRGDKFAIKWSDGWYRCTEEPPRTVWEPRAGFGPICGDPWSFGKFNNRRSDIAGIYTMYWTNGYNRAKAESKYLAAGDWKRTQWRWVKFGTWMRITAKPVGVTPAVVETVKVRKVTRAEFRHWGVGKCPAKP